MNTEEATAQSVTILNLYKLIKPARLKRKVTLQQVVDLAELTDTAQLSKIESGKVGCTFETLDKIFSVLRIKIYSEC